MPIDRDSLTAADALTGAETFDCNQGTGSARRTKKVTGVNLAAYIGGILDGDAPFIASVAAAVVPLITESFIVSLSDLTSTVSAGNNKGHFRNPYSGGFTITALYIEALTAQTGGSLVTVDMNVDGSTILSTKLTLDNGESDSNTAATQHVRTTSSLAFRAKVTFDIDLVGDGTLRGLNAVVKGYQTQ